MRRVNESVRAVVAEGLGELKDPRIGMVTVTGAVVSPDLGEARIFVSVFGNEKKRRATLAGLDSARGVLQAKIGRELSLRRTPTLTFAYDDSVERGVRMTKLIDEVAADLPMEPPPEESTGMPEDEPDHHRNDLQAVADAVRSHDRFVVAAHENPDGDALGSMLAMTLALARSARTSSCTCPARHRRRASTAFSICRGCSRELPADLAERVLIAVDCANDRRIGPESAPVELAKSVVNIDHHHDNSALAKST